MKSTTYDTQGTCRLQLCRYCTVVLVVASQICEIPRNSTKIRTYRSSRSSKVIDLGVNRKRICNFLLAYLLIVTMDVSITVFRDIDSFSSKIACFYHTALAWRHSGGTSCNINVIYMATIPLLTLQVYLHSFSRCWLPKSRNHAKYRQNLTLQQFKVIQGIDLGVNRNT